MRLEEILPAFVEEGTAWVVSGREALRPDASPLTDRQRTALAPFYEPATLDGVRLARVAAIENPPFYRSLAGSGIDLINFSRSVAITWIDVVVVSEEFLPAPPALVPVLFHELVHVVQFELLGPRGFVDAMVRSYLQNGCRYDEIPIEKAAVRLQQRFLAEPDRPFAVRVEVERALGE